MHLCKKKVQFMVDFSCLTLALFFDDSKTAARRLWGKVDCATSVKAESRLGMVQDVNMLRRLLDSKKSTSQKSKELIPTLAVCLKGVISLSNP